mgnify:CR=1 FL=1
MKKLLWLSLWFIIGVSITQNSIAEESISSSTVERVLFVGNSFSYFNNGIHNHLANLVRSSGQWKKDKSRFRLMTISGGQLVEHQAGLQQMLLSSQWDKVVLQPYSIGPISKPNKKTFQKGSLILSEMIRKAGSEPVFFMTWAYKGQPLMMEQLNEAYTETAKSLNAQLVPVGLAFAAVSQSHPSIELYTADVDSFDESGKLIVKEIIKHPSLAGTYLAASVFYASFYHQSPEGLSYTAGLPVEEVRILQQTAWEIVQKYNN